MVELTKTPAKRVSHISIRARRPLSSYSEAAFHLLGRWLDVETTLLREILEALHAGEAYNAYRIPKAGRKEWREIHDPYGGLKEVQRRILDRLLYPVAVSNAAHGAVQGRSVVTNALQHLPDAQNLLCLDIRHAFPSVRFSRVHKIFRRYVRPLFRSYGPLPATTSAGLDPVDEAIHLLAGLTTLRQEVWEKGKKKNVYALPQGAPTSGYLLNLACLPLDRKIFKIIKNHDHLQIRYTRYLDDIAISTPQELPADVQEEIEFAVLKNDFRLHRHKTQRLGPGDPHVICGVMLKDGQLAAEPELLDRCQALLQRANKVGDPRTERQRRKKIRGVMAFFRQVYGRDLPNQIQESYQNYRKVRNLPEELIPAPARHQIVRQRPALQQDAKSLLAQWLDLSVETVQEAEGLLDAGNGYEEWSIDKKNGSKRQICSPRDQLKEIQERILSRLLYHIPVSVASHGFVPSRSIVTNALAHLQATHMINLDLKDAFPSVNQHRVEHALQIGLGTIFKKFGVRVDSEVRQSLVKLIAKLTTFNDQLPQGSPTSGYLLNLACRTLDKRIFELLGEIAPNVIYTRYADDLTFTSREPMPENILKRIKRTIQRAGFKWHPQKTHVAAAAKGQNLEICGLRVVGSELRISPKKMKGYRSVLRRAASQIPTGQLDADTRSHVQGIVGFVQMVYGELPHNLAKPYEAFLRQHPSARPTGSAREKFAQYPRIAL